MSYNFKNIEKKWQNKWEKEGTFNAKTDYNMKKWYGLIEFPYPSGQGLHVGHPRSYTALDIIARKRRLQGYNVLYLFIIYFFLSFFPSIVSFIFMIGSFEFCKYFFKIYTKNINAPIPNII